jgi:hypothetical protein
MSNSKPVCNKFLQGTCINEKCPFLHVKQSKRKRNSEQDESSEEEDHDSDNEDDEENETKRPRTTRSLSIIPTFI